MKIILVAMAVCFSYEMYAQTTFTPVDREQVKRWANDTNAINSYKRLLGLYNDFDASLSLADYRLLYYGFAFSGKYNGYADHKKGEIIKHLNNKRYKEASNLCDSVLEKIPVSLIANYYKGLALYYLDEKDPTSMYYRDRYMKLRDAILSSGDGLSCKTAFKILFITDEYEIMYNYFEIEEFKGQSLQSPCDKLRIKPNHLFKAEAMFFDVSESMNSLMNLFKDKK